ncbi:Polysaccharide biosynthesis protein [Clostridium cavendishii DSM 21758]|uniref:Polysaccharide biosynthesis protein n=1 Tax=Clostridium cavendishii DSM 21758 TaxID=1121302 RepID=A0A1M6B105_9CLOT|nr:SDR family NAD(P)-dependent oxidoreductase [Clostridium cavendishii]SHI42402.1 Polysaccharide biosynthesis protein [Clostridium cavendishii DSM 21758]
MNFFKGKKILVIGGTGTIGTGLIKELIKENPKVIRVFSRDEYKQFEMQNSPIVRDYNNFRFLIGDVRDYERVERAMSGIDIVFNLAAMKHVGSCEYNPTEAIKTNVDGVENVIKAAVKHNVECVLFTSSDKSINPTNTYGATKMLGEKLMQAANYSKGGVKTRFIAVRFGNVMGSRGSVIPLFKKQILEGNRITITDPSMSRFMMTVSQATKLMMKSCEIANGGELFVLKMPVINLKDLAEVVIEETSKRYEIDKDNVHIDIIGIRPGEKLYEELMTMEESHYSKDLGDMYVVFPTTYNKAYFEKCYKDFKLCRIGNYTSKDYDQIDKEQVRNMIKEERLI